MMNDDILLKKRDMAHWRTRFTQPFVQQFALLGGEKKTSSHTP